MNGIPIGKWEVNGILKLRNDQKHGKYLKPMGDPLGPNKSNGFAWKLKLQFTARKQVLQVYRQEEVDNRNYDPMSGSGWASNFKNIFIPMQGKALI